MIEVVQIGQQTRVTVDPGQTPAQVMAALEAHDSTWTQKMQLMPDGAVLFRGNGKPIDIAFIQAKREG